MFGETKLNRARHEYRALMAVSQKADVMKCVAYKRLVRGSLLGFAELQLDNGLVLLSCSHHAANERQWINPPGRPQLDAAHQLMTDAAGKILYAPVVGFADRQTRNRWSSAAVTAIAEYLSADSIAPAVAGAMNGGEMTPEPRRARSHYGS